MVEQYYRVTVPVKILLWMLKVSWRYGEHRTSTYCVDHVTIGNRFLWGGADGY